VRPGKGRRLGPGTPAQAGAPLSPQGVPPGLAEALCGGWTALPEGSAAIPCAPAAGCAPERGWRRVVAGCVAARSGPSGPA